MDIFSHILFYDFLKFFLLINTPYGQSRIFVYVERYFAVSFQKYLCLNLYLSILNYKFVFDVTDLVVDTPGRVENFYAHVFSERFLSRITMILNVFMLTFLIDLVCNSTEH